MNGHKPLTTFQIADYCHVSHRTVQQWISKGKLKSYRTPGNHSRIRPEDFWTFLNQFNLPVPEGIPAPLSDKKKILIVDDDRTIVATIRGLLKRNEQYILEEAYNGFMAGEKCASFKPDLITLDIRMPQLDGLRVLKELRTDPKYINLKIVVITGITDKPEIQKIIELGVDDFLSKPFDGKDLLTSVGRLLTEKTSEMAL